jgi:hypothetical protein
MNTLIMNVFYTNLDYDTTLQHNKLQYVTSPTSVFNNNNNNNDNNNNNESFNARN